MAQINPGVIKALNHLYRIVVAGEKGFAVAAKNVSNRGLKLLFKTYAQQRAEFAGELAKEIRRLGGKVTERGSIRGLIHRGRIDIVAALTIGEENRERVVLGEAVQGERAALRTYERTLQVDLPPETRSIVERQHAAVKEVSQRVALMRGKAEDRLVVRLFDSDQDLNEAIAALREADFPPNAIKTIGINEVHTLYEGRGSTVMETVISGAFGGALWGSVFGAVSAWGILLLSDMEPLQTAITDNTWAVVALLSILIGAFFGAVLGLFIGVGISQEDSYLYEDSVEHGHVLMMVQASDRRATEASQIMHQINAASRAQPRNVPS